jgi:hypothetical protein
MDNDRKEMSKYIKEYQFLNTLCIKYVSLIKKARNNKSKVLYQQKLNDTKQRIVEINTKINLSNRNCGNLNDIGDNILQRFLKMI